MKNKLLIFILLVHISTAINAQERIVQKSGDSLNSSISKESGEKYSAISFAFSGGYSYLNGKADDLSTGHAEYYRQINTGYNFSGEMNYFISRRFGIGAKYSMFKTKATISRNEINSSPFLSGDLENKISTSFIGPSFLLRYLSKNDKHAVIVNLSIGCVSYKNDAMMDSLITVTGSCAGIDIGIAYEYKLTDNFAIGAKISLFGAALKKVTYDYGEGQVIQCDYVSASLNRFDYNLVMRFTF